MDKASYLKDNLTGSHKENSPPSADGVHHKYNEPVTIPAAGGRTVDNDNGIRIDNIPGMQQPLQVNNGHLPKNKQNVQPELLQKFRQLRQWQQQQQETMFKKQQQQMETIKLQQDKLQSLFKKAATATSPNTVHQPLYQLGDSPANNQGIEISSTRKSSNQGVNPVTLSPMDDFVRTVITKNHDEPFGYQSLASNSLSPYSYTPRTPNGKATSPVLMTPMQFTTRASYSSQSPLEEDANSSRTMYSRAEPARAFLGNGVYPSHALHEPDNKGFRDFDACSSDTESGGQSDAETMSGIYPLQDDNVSEACGIEREEEEHSDELSINEECDLENTVCERFPNNNENVAFETENGEERPIRPGIGASKAVTTFEELLEKELTSGTTNVHGNATTATLIPSSPQRPQRTFLKKGQGLARFRMNPPQPKRLKTSQKSGPPPQKRLTKLQKESNSLNQGHGVSQTQAAIPQVKVQRKIAGRAAQASSDNSTAAIPFGSSILASRVIGPFTSMPYTMPTSNTAVTKTTLTVAKRGVAMSISSMRSPLSSLDFSFQNQKKELEVTKEDEDLEEFEMLEEAAANASFSSNSSLVVKMIQRARTKTAGGKNPATAKSDSLPTSRNLPVNIPSILSPVDTGYGSCEGRGPGSVNIASQASSVENVTENEASDSEESDHDTTLKEAENEPEYEPYPQHPLEEEPTAAMLTSQEGFDDEEAWGEIKAQTESTETESDEDSDDSDVTIGEPMYPMMVLQGVQKPQPFVGTTSGPNAMTTPPTSALVSKLFPKLKQKPKVQEEEIDAPEERKCEVTESTGPTKEVQEKLKELEEEINKFRLENKALAKIRNERDEGLKRLQNEIDLFEKQKTEELERIERFKKEEMQKMKRERKVFEKYQKAVKSIPDKKEREEIEVLKSQVCELQDELKRRESRWSAASSRQRNRIEALEEQNKELQEEVKLLEKYRLERWRENEMKTKDNEEARPRDTVLRKTAKPVEPVDPEVKHPMQQEPVNNDGDDSFRNILPQAPSPFRVDDRQTTSTVDVNNNKNKGTSTNLQRKTERAEPLSPNAMIRNTDKHGVPPTREPINRPTAKDSQSTNVQTKPRALQEIEHPDGKVEQVQADGSRVILFANGTRKEISKDGQTVIVSFFNGDFKQVFPDQRVVYHYSEAKTTHTTYPDGLEVLQFPNNQIEKHYVDGTKEIIFPDQTIKYLYVDGTEECVYADGTIQRMRSADGEKIIEFPNGQREVHTKHFKRREYPDGTVKTVYPDGRTETRYSTGRLRVKNREGKVVMDTEQ